MIKAVAAYEPGGELKPFEYDPGVLGADEVEIRVEYCGICRSDFAMLDNEHISPQNPLVPGHEVVGQITAIGEKVKNRYLNQRVGLGWYSGSCMTCEWCKGGDHNLCGEPEQTIVGRYGGFADKVRAHHTWVIPLPDGIDSVSAGPLFCGGVTVFNPIVQFGIKPGDRVAVIGIGGLGHMAIQYLHAWGCEVTAFSSNPDKETDAKALGADHFMDSRSSVTLESVKNSFDMVMSTANADLDWAAYMRTLRPLGRLHFVGGVPNPIAIPYLLLADGQRCVSGSPVGSPNTIAQLLDFVADNQLNPVVETFPFEKVNEAVDKFRTDSSQIRYRMVLEM